MVARDGKTDEDYHDSQGYIEMNNDRKVIVLLARILSCIESHDGDKDYRGATNVPFQAQRIPSRSHRLRG